MNKVIIPLLLIIVVTLSVCNIQSIQGKNCTAIKTTSSNSPTSEQNTGFKKLVTEGRNFIEKSEITATNGEVYNYKADEFYSKSKIYATWIMIWNGSTEKHWWKPDDYGGSKVLVNKKWQSIDWNNPEHIKTYFNEIKAAGINVIIVDFTNGFRWEWQAKLVQKLCYENYMKFCIAFNPNAGENMEEGCRQIWETYTKPGTAYSSAYLYKEDKPLVVLYTWRDGYEKSIAQSGEFRSKFSTAWASGEESEKNKWGWQVEPQVGAVPSNDSMFVSGSIKFDSPNTSQSKWRKSISWLDYNFMLTRISNPKYIIVGSFDDIQERNSWMIADTTNTLKGWQQRDINGSITTDAYYKRVRDWILHGKPQTIEGGIIRDGAYRVVSCDGRVMGVEDNRKPNSIITLKKNYKDIENYIWFYHLGKNEYRIVKLNSGLSFDVKGNFLYQNWDENVDSQKWIVKPAGKGKFQFINKATKKAIGFSGNKLIPVTKGINSAAQTWNLIEDLTIPK